MTLLATAGTHPSALWVLTRATGMVALVLLTASVVLGVAASAGWSSDRWPRFLSQDLHRNLSLLCVVTIAIHVVTTVVDGYVPIAFIDAVVPFRTPYRTLYVGLGALAFDLFLALLVTSALRRWVGYQAWRTVHWFAYLCWPLAFVHALGTGTDTRNQLVTAVNVSCAAAVLGSSLWWVAVRRDLSGAARTAAAAGGTVAVVAIVAFAYLGPLRPGWSHRASGVPTDARVAAQARPAKSAAGGLR